MMPSEALLTAAAQLELLKLQIMVKFTRSTRLPPFKGSLLHGWLGQALQQYSGDLYHLLFEQHDGSHPKPYSITVGADQKTQWQAGELYEFGLTLFGDAAQVADAVVEALNQFPSKAADGEADFAVCSVSSMLPNGRMLHGNHPYSLAEGVTTNLGMPAEAITLSFLTPARYKLRGNICRHIPDIQFIAQQGARRLVDLATYWAMDEPELLALITKQIPRGFVNRVVDNSYYEDWLRFSHKSRRLLPFGGIKGQIAYEGDLAPLLPYLLVGEQLQTGGKTTFGLGQIRVIGG